MFANLGKIIFTGIGGLMFDQIGRNAPFVFMAICDTVVVIAALIMNKLGYIKNE